MSGFWALGRLPASFRGVPFVVVENNRRRGRQVALHTYPFRDDPWPEDLGRSPRVTSLRGFVVGDDADAQIAALEAAVETPGPGQLVHPSIGALLVQVLDFVANDQPDRGRMWSFEMTVVPYVARIYPVTAASTQAQTQGLFGSFGTAVASDFAGVASAIGQAQQAVTGVVQTVQAYTAQATGLISDATSLAHLPAALSGNFGRFAGGGLAANATSLGGGITSIAQASGVVNGALSSAGRISGTLASLAGTL